MENNPTNVDNTQTQGAGAQPTFDEGKINRMIEDRVKGMESNILKDYFKKQGLSEDEVGNAINTYKQQQQQKVDEANKKLDADSKELEELRAFKRNTEITSASRKVAKAMGIGEDRVEAIIKLADKSTYIGKDGKLSEDAIKTSFEQALNDFPFLKQEASGQNTGIQQMGTDMSQGGQENGFNFSFAGVRAKK